MPQYDFNQPMTFLNALEQFIVAYYCVMVALRDESQFRDEPNQAVLNGAHLFCSLLEDGEPEAVALTDQLERRAYGTA